MSVAENRNKHILHHIVLPHDHFSDLSAKLVVLLPEKIYCFYV
jgi:hypothetical protein